MKIFFFSVEEFKTKDTKIIEISDRINKLITLYIPRCLKNKQSFDHQNIINLA